MRRAIDASPQRIGRFIDLAQVSSPNRAASRRPTRTSPRPRRSRPNSPKLVFAKADIYIKNGRNLEVAKDLLKHYMSMKLSPDDPPRAGAEKLLKQVQGS